MRIRVERNGTAFEFERPPMPESRFKAVCAVIGAALYVGMILIVAALCGIYGVVAVVIVSLFAFAFSMA